MWVEISKLLLLFFAVQLLISLDFLLSFIGNSLPLSLCFDEAKSPMCLICAKKNLVYILTDICTCVLSCSTPQVMHSWRSRYVRSSQAYPKHTLARRVEWLRRKKGCWLTFNVMQAKYRIDCVNPSSPSLFWRKHSHRRKCVVMMGRKERGQKKFNYPGKILDFLFLLLVQKK